MFKSILRWFIGEAPARPRNRYMILSRYNKALLDEDIKQAEALGWDSVLDGKQCYTEQIDGELVTVYEQGMIKRPTN